MPVCFNGGESIFFTPRLRPLNLSQKVINRLKEDLPLSLSASTRVFYFQNKYVQSQQVRNEDVSLIGIFVDMISRQVERQIKMGLMKSEGPLGGYES